jgi:hypothetical protein
MIKVNERFDIRQDSLQWILDEWKTDENGDRVIKEVKEDARPPKPTRTTYHPNIGAICKYVLDTYSKDCNTLKEIREILESWESAVDQINTLKQEK